MLDTVERLRAVADPLTVPTNMVYIPPGSFYMGSPANEPLRGNDEGQYLVTLSRGFWMARYEVTQDEYFGLLAIKREGGVALVQAPEEAREKGMPTSALAHVDVDHSGTIAQIVPWLSRLLTQESPRVRHQPPS